MQKENEMNINQRILYEDKAKLEKFLVQVSRISSVIDIIIRIILFVMSIYIFVRIWKNILQGGIDVLWTGLLFAADAEISVIKRIRKKQKSSTYLKNLDKAIGKTTPEFYDVKADNTAVTVNDVFTLKWTDVYSATFTKDYVVLSSKKKTAVMIQADDELKAQISDILSRNKTDVYCVVNTPVNKAAAKQTGKRNLFRILKRAAIMLVLAMIPYIYLVKSSGLVKNLVK